MKQRVDSLISSRDDSFSDPARNVARSNEPYKDGMKYYDAFESLLSINYLENKYDSDY